MDRPTSVLLTGATGFVGRHLYPELWKAGFRVRCASRDPMGAARRFPGREWVRFDSLDPASVAVALRDVDAAVYLVHAMAGGPGYATREAAAAGIFRDEANVAGLRRVVYLGGVAPTGTPSPHLQSRLDTGATLRAGPVPVVELRAAMIVGEGSASWHICRDLAARLPFMVLPRWLESRSEPVAVGDVVRALRRALEIPDAAVGVYDLPGPEVLTAEEILVRIARLRGTRPTTVHVPLLTPRLSSLWLRVVSGADYTVAKELVEGLTNDLVSTSPSFWAHMEGARPTPFDEAA
ncbi:MAG: NAD-dependent epimerase/dehydratase family protein, partial [Myxococcota bacterium]